MPEESCAEYVQIEEEGHTALIQDTFVRLDQFRTLEEAFEKFTRQPAVREAIKNHKSNWVANSKGGEPNHMP